MKSVFTILALCLLFCGCATTSLRPMTSNDVTLEEDEKRLWTRSGEEQRILNKSGLIYTDDELNLYFNSIAMKVRPQELSADVPIRVVVIKNHLLNAFAFPNGVIYLHTGILARMENEAQLATLLGHEMTHVTHRHLIKETRDIKNKTAFFATIQVTLVGIGGAAGSLVSMLGALGTMASVSGYSKDLEAEADLQGLRLMANAGYDANEAPKLFVHLKEDADDDKNKEPFFFGSHPKLQERIENCETYLKDHPSNGGKKETDTFLKMIKNVILENAELDIKAGKFKFARAELDRYLSINPDDPKAYYLLGEIIRQKDESTDINAAKEFYLEAVSLDAAYPDPYRGLGMLCFKKGEKTSAREYFETYLAKSHNSADKPYIEEYLRQCTEGGVK